MWVGGWDGLILGINKKDFRSYIQFPMPDTNSSPLFSHTKKKKIAHHTDGFTLLGVGMLLSLFLFIFGKIIQCTFLEMYIKMDR